MSIKGLAGYEFIERLNDEVFRNISNCQSNVRHFDYKTLTIQTQFKKRFFRKIARKILNILGIERRASVKNLNLQMLRVASQFEFLYGILEDEQSKELLVKIAAFRILTSGKVKMPLQNEDYWQNVVSIQRLADLKKSKSIKHLGTEVDVPFFNLLPLGYDVVLYYNSYDIASTFLQRQYEYHNKQTGKKVSAKEAEIIIDGGACWGDTALFFASTTNAVKIYSFEFIPQNLEMLNANLAANPQYQNRIEVVKNALWSEGDIDVYYNDWGGASVVKPDIPSYGSDGSVKAVSLDDFTAANNLSKVDFIKLDTEGAELKILKGARKTLIKHKPRLAIAIYHTIEDFNTIPAYIAALNLGYKFYLGHHTPSWTETILYCEPS